MLRPFLLLALIGRSVAAQASPYIPLDHPLLPLAEHLIDRGELADPSPLVRPFRRADLVGLLDRLVTPARSSNGRAIATLRDRFRERRDDAWFRMEPRAGVQAFTRARRDLLRPAGSGGVRAYADAALEARVGALVLVSRPVAENRLKLDPDWSGAALQQTKRQAYRFAEAYVGAQFGRVRLLYGMLDRNWGPVGTPGLGLANAGYPRTDLGFELRLRDIQIDIVGTELTPMLGSDGRQRQRYFMAHRLNVRLHRTLRLAVWETAVLAGADRSFEPTFRNPLVLLAFPVQFGMADDRNTLLGGDLYWRPRRGLGFEAQAAIDDRWRRAPDPEGTGEPAHPGRWAVTVAGAGALGDDASWRATAAVVSSLAFRTGDSTESFVDRGMGIGPQFPDHVLLTLAISRPLAGRWLVTPDVAVLWQGEGRIGSPFPVGPALAATPELFIGTRATTYRFGARLAGGTRRLGVLAAGGVHHTTNADHVRGLSRTRFEARLLASVGLTTGGVLR